MSQTVIHVEGLGKRYRIGERERYLALRDVLTNAMKAPWRLFQGRGSSNHHRQHIWALKDVSFEVGEGEVVGIIGRNGAGKTTLLKILARVTRPTEGYAEIRGRMGSLLEVGTGFHPELTGRENVYLSGAILGMSKREIERKFDEIVAFAEVEKFIDTPLKYYSSGMQVRLAFAVAAHLEPEILLVDEVLAVGDAAFQKKCMGKMNEVARAGRTILFVSHNMGAISNLCQSCFLLQDGHIVLSGRPDEVLQAYLSATFRNRLALCEIPDEMHVSGDGGVRIFRVGVRNSEGSPSVGVQYGEPFSIEVLLRVLRRTEAARIGFLITDVTGIKIMSAHYPPGYPDHVSLEPGSYKIVARVRPNFLRPAIYSIHVGGHRAVLGHGSGLDNVPDAFQLEVSSVPYQGKTLRGHEEGFITLTPEWNLERLA